MPTEGAAALGAKALLSIWGSLAGLVIALFAALMRYIRSVDKKVDDKTSSETMEHRVAELEQGHSELGARLERLQNSAVTHDELSQHIQSVNENINSLRDDVRSLAQRIDRQADGR